MKRLFTVVLLLTTVISSINALNLDKDSIIYMKSTDMGKLYLKKTYSRVSVHDPSIVVDGSKYYIFGSHRASAVTTNLWDWTWNDWTYGIKTTSGGTTKTTDCANVFTTNQTKTVKILQGTDTVSVTFGNFDCDAWRYTEDNPSLSGNQWAPDVLWNPYLKKWCMYMSLNGDDWRSSIALLTSTSINGPYIYQGPVVFSGFHWNSTDYKKTDLELVLGTQSSLPSRYALGSSWSRRWPNCIDPCVFFDEEGELWMSYGSWFGGIFMLRLDKETGLRDYTYTYPATNNNSDGCTSDPYFGKKIAGGFYSSGEGSYIEHIGKYYYLFVSHGGLTSTGGYEMHYYRSTKPNGPYTDASGNSAIYSKYMMNYGLNATTTQGMKILGHYQWENMDYAEISQGHNSMLQDADGRVYLIYHTRFNDGEEGHQVRVHQMFYNVNNWLVASPFEFTGCKYTQADIDSTELCTTNDIVGTYKFLIHPYKIDYENQAFQSPITIVLNSAGRITGDYVGTWKIKAGTSYITLHMRPKLTTTYTDYYGVIYPETVSGSNMPSVCFTAIANSGVSVWGCNVDGNYAIDYTYKNFTIPVTARQNIKEDIDLFTNTMYWGSSISWESDHPELLSNDGKLLVPYVATGDSTTLVGLTYTLKKDNYALKFTRNVRVRTNKSYLVAKEDVNQDGSVDSQDVLKVYDFMRTSTGTETSPLEDVNGDGNVDSQDILQIYDYIKTH